MTATAPTTFAPPRVLGAVVDAQTRCEHYRGERDVVALRFACCGEFFPCFECHEQSAGHPAERWTAADLAERAVLCGVCAHRLSVDEYLRLGEDPACPACEARFNPGCRLHHERYFDFPRSLATGGVGRAETTGETPGR